MNTFGSASSPRSAAVGGLAVVGFIALVVAGIWLAIYSIRFVPSVVSRIGTAAVYLGSVFTPAPPASLSVVPTASTTIPFGEASSTISTSASSTTATTSSPAPTKKIVAPPTAGKQTSGTYQISGATTPSVTSGLPDLVVSINALGYLATTSADSFVATSTVPAGSRPAVSFSVKNVGGSATGAWRFSASIPTQTAYIYQSSLQQSLNPGDSIDYTLGFDQANKGSDQTVSISVNFDRAVTESNTDNNNASAKITIAGN